MAKAESHEIEYNAGFRQTVMWAPLHSSLDESPSRFNGTQLNREVPHDGAGVNAHNGLRTQAVHADPPPHHQRRRCAQAVVFNLMPNVLKQWPGKKQVSEALDNRVLTG